jgi:hypothetical protein
MQRSCADVNYTVKKAFGFTGCCGFFRFWDQKSPSMGAGIFYPIYEGRFLNGEKENQFRLYERGFFRLQNTQAINPPPLFSGKSLNIFIQPPPTYPLHGTAGCNVGNQLKQGEKRRACVCSSLRSSYLAVFR